MANITPSQNTPDLPNIRRSVTRPSGASCSPRNSAKVSLATMINLGWVSLKLASRVALVQACWHFVRDVVFGAHAGPIAGTAGGIAQFGGLCSFATHFRQKLPSMGLGMRCVRCDSQNKPDNEFCEGCGAALGLKCDVCEHVNGPASRFCGQCGAALANRAAGPDPSAQRMLRSLSSKGGERKNLTIMFADIRNSTSLLDSLGDPELAMRRLEPVLNLMKDAVHRYDGIVNKIQGDGVMALFGAPRPHEDHAVRGCLAALAMQDSVARLADPSLQIRVGLHTGEVVVQTIENSIYQTYDAAGANVHIANRMEQMADAGCILVTKDTYAGARQFVEVAPLGLQPIRGIAAPLEIFKLTGLLNAPASDIFRSGKRLTPLIGRSDQFAALELELGNTIKGDGRVVGVVGEAGIGKSRLCFEFAEACRRQGVRVYEGRVLAHGRATPFQPVLELLRDIFGIRAKDPAEMSRRKVIERFGTIASSDQQLLLLLEFLGLTDPDRPAPKLDSRALKIQLLDLVRALVRSRPGDTPTMVLIEDLHWIDAASEEFIETLTSGRAAPPRYFPHDAELNRQGPRALSEISAARLAHNSPLSIILSFFSKPIVPQDLQINETVTERTESKAKQKG